VRYMSKRADFVWVVDNVLPSKITYGIGFGALLFVEYFIHPIVSLYFRHAVVLIMYSSVSLVFFIPAAIFLQNAPAVEDKKMNTLQSFVKGVPLILSSKLAFNQLWGSGKSVV